MQIVIQFIEKYLFFPTLIQKVISFLLLPLTFIYCFIILSKRFLTKEIDFKVPIISVGNILVGGTGKTPITIALAKNKKDSCVILRGYGRKSKGLIVVSKNGKILVDVEKAGDEAILLAHNLPNSIIIVSEDRVKAIKKAKELNCKIIFLDDGFTKHNIKKFNIVLKPAIEPTNNFCLPSGGYREPKFSYKYADLILKEDIDFIRKTKIINPTKNMILITAISKPERLNQFLPKNIIEKIYFPDHYFFTKDELENLIKKYNATSILTTEKDLVKMDKFNLSISLLKLDIEIKTSIPLNF